MYRKFEDMDRDIKVWHLGRHHKPNKATYFDQNVLSRMDDDDLMAAYTESKCDGEHAKGDEVVVPAQNYESMTNEQMLYHLKEFHGISFWTRQRKQELIDAHNKAHAYRYFNSGARSADEVMPIMHEHEGALGTASAELPEGIDATMAGIENAKLEKPLNKEQRTTLLALVDNDFNTMLQRLNAETARAYTQADEEVAASFAEQALKATAYRKAADKKLTEIQKRAAAMVEKANKMLADLKADAEADGVNLNVPMNSAPRFAVESTAGFTGEKEAQKAARAEIDQKALRVRATIEAQRLKVRRIILESGLPAEAKDFLAALPKAEDTIKELVDAVVPAAEITAG